MVVRVRGCPVPPRESVEAVRVVSVTYRISVFGPVTVFVDGVALKLEGPQSSHVLAVLAIRLGTPVRRADLVNEVWTTRPEPKTVDSRISRLRDTLRRAPGLEIPRADSSGYRLRAERNRIDLHRFTDLAGQALTAARESRPDAEKLLRQALELWQREPFDGLHGPIIDKQRARLWLLRLEMYTEYATLRILAGGAAEVVDELIEFAEAHPEHTGVRDAAIRALKWVGRIQEAADLRPRDLREDRNAHGGYRDELLAYLSALRTALGRALRWHPGEELAATFCTRSVRMVGDSTAHDAVAGRLHLRNRGLVRGDADWDDAVALPRLIVVLGDAGYGKTWQLRRHGQVLCDRAMSALRRGADITAVDLPLWLHASALAEQVGARQYRAEQLVDGAIRTIGDEDVVVGPLLRDHLIKRLTSEEGRLRVLVDAYDEVFDSRGKDTVQAGLAWLGRQVRAGDGLRVILTSRPVGYVCPFSTRETTVPVHHVELGALTVGQVRQLWQTWFNHLGVEVPESRLQPLLSRNSPLAEHVQVPLIAAFCAWVAQEEAASSTRVGLYEQVIRRFIGMWWKQGDQSPHGHHTRHDPVRQLQIRHALEQLAWHMAAGEGEWRDWVYSKECESELGEAGLSPLPGWSRTAELVDLHGVLLRLGNRPATQFDSPIAWVHPNVQEYLAANSLIALPAREVEYWLEHSHNRPEWAATVIFAAELEAAQDDA